MDKVNFFDSVYRTYDKVRPEYPYTMFEKIFEYKDITPGSRVFEIGIGTGKAVQPFIDLNCIVASVEPGKKMCNFLRKKYADYEDFSCYNMTFSKYMGMNETFDLIYSATALHHLPEEETYTKIYKLLKKGGALARFAYHAGEDTARPRLMFEIRQLYKEYMNSTDDYRGYTVSDAKQVSVIAPKYGFTDIHMEIFNFSKDYTADEYIKLLSTYPDHAEIEEEKRKDFFKKIKKAIKNHGGIITVEYMLDLHLARKI